MALPLDLLDEIGQTYGPTRKLHQALAKLVAATIENLERSRNGTNVQGVSFGSPTASLVPPPMQLPMRIDASLQHLDHLSHETGAGSSIVNLSSNIHRPMPIRTSEHTSIPGIPWQEPVNGQTLPPQDTQSSLQGVSTDKVSNVEFGRVSPSEEFDDSLWKQLEWTGGWDDFLNAIAM
jgi:hypothetical protein